MSARGGAVLYTPEILALAVELARFPFQQSAPLRGEAHSRVCGSRVSLCATTTDAGRIVEVGARVSACAIGQASAALFLQSAEGRDAAAIGAAHAEIRAWLSGGADLPNWPGIAVLEPARAYSARHSAILLPWEAALAALSNPPRAD